MKVRWISPSFSGFKIGTSYVPSKTNNGNMSINGGNAPESDQLDMGVNYTGKMGANTVKGSLTWWTTDAGTAATEAFALGASTTFGAFTLGAGYKEVKPDGKTKLGASMAGSGDSSFEEEVINFGLQWSQGPATISANYFKSEMPLGSTVGGDDSLRKYTLGAQYNMGPGVDFLGSIQNVAWQDELATALNSNKGVAVVGGIKVSF